MVELRQGRGNDFSVGMAVDIHVLLNNCKSKKACT